MSRFPKVQRRTVLRGLGAAVALPMLEAMRPARTLLGAEAASAAAPVRLAYIFFPNGAVMDRFKPSEEGENYTLPPILEPLAPHKADILSLGGLTQNWARAHGDGGGDHARSASCFLTGAKLVKTDGTDIRVGQSIDQAVAERIGHLTRLPSLELGIEQGRNAGNCDSGYSCAYSSNISWKTATTPMAKEIIPRKAFERLFGEAGDDKARAKRMHYRRSILDLVSDDAARLQGRLGRTDRRKLDEYFTSVREIEQRIERADQMKPREIPEFEAPDGVPEDHTEHIRLMFDLMALAFETDSTRVISFMLANEGTNRTYPMAGVNDGWHHISHHGRDKEKLDKLARIDRYLVEQFGYFLGKLKSIKEGERTLLDNSLVLFGSAIADSDRHAHDDLPILLAGRGGGTVKPGRHVNYPNETPLNNLFLSMAERTGVNLDRLGDSSGVLKGLDG